MKTIIIQSSVIILILVNGKLLHLNLINETMFYISLVSILTLGTILSAKKNICSH